MRTLLQRIFKPFFVWMANKLSSSPKKEDVFTSLSKLFRTISRKKSSRGIVMEFSLDQARFIIFSDQHKGTKDFADDFRNNEQNYIAALNYYRQEDYSYINLGDCEELWKYKAEKVIPQYKDVLALEAAFHQNEKYYRTFGNHDLLWKNKLDVELLLKNIFQMPLPVYEGIIIKINSGVQFLNIFLTHGHQGDKMSDNNALSTWLVAHIWSPIQRYLRINVNTPATDFHLRDKHNILMYEWSSRHKKLVLITGHTHKPVFASGKYTDNEIHTVTRSGDSKALRPSYFNSGCCCYDDGDITGIEIADGYIRLIKWKTTVDIPSRIILEEVKLSLLMNEL